MRWNGRKGWEENRKKEMESDGMGQMEIGREEEDCFHRKGKVLGGEWEEQGSCQYHLMLITMKGDAMSCQVLDSKALVLQSDFYISKIQIIQSINMTKKY